MALLVHLKDIVLGKSIEMSLKPDTTIEDVLVNSADYLGKQPGVYMIKYGNKILPGDITVAEAGIKSGSELELLPDPEGG